MVSALSDIARQMGWDSTLSDTFVWVDYSCIPQSNGKSLDSEQTRGEVGAGQEGFTLLEIYEYLHYLYHQ